MIKMSHVFGRDEAPGVGRKQINMNDSQIRKNTDNNCQLVVTAEPHTKMRLPKLLCWKQRC